MIKIFGEDFKKESENRKVSGREQHILIIITVKEGLEAVRVRRAGPGRCLTVMPSTPATGPIFPHPPVEHKAGSGILQPSRTNDGMWN